MGKPRKYTFHVRKAGDGQWYATLVAGNGETVMVTETYTRRASAVRSAQRIREAIASAVVEEPTK